MKFHFRLVFVCLLSFFLILLYLCGVIQEDTNHEHYHLSDHPNAGRNVWAQEMVPNRWLPTGPDVPGDALTGSSSDRDSSKNTTKIVKHTEAARVLIHARMRTGSSVTGTLLNNHPDFYYVYEPGHMLVEDKSLDLYGDSFQNLETIRPDLVQFMHGIFTCNFTGKEFYIKSLQRHLFMRQNSRALADQNLPIREKDLSRICSEKKHIAVKTVRLNNLILASSVLKENKVKVIHIVRDPRGMMLSRRNMQRLPTNYNEKKGPVVFDNRLERIITDYCQWVNDNYKAATQGPQWIQEQYFLLRYEDLVDRPMIFVPRMFDFIGLPVDNVTSERIQSSDWWSGHGEAWRTGLSIDEVRRVQELCPTVFHTFGYDKISTDLELKNLNNSLVVPLDETKINPEFFS